MLKGYRHILTLFTSFAWWKTEPRDDLVDRGAFCLAELGEQCVLSASVREPGTAARAP